MLNIDVDRKRKLWIICPWWDDRQSISLKEWFTMTTATLSPG